MLRALALTSMGLLASLLLVSVAAAEEIPRFDGVYVGTTDGDYLQLRPVKTQRRTICDGPYSDVGLFWSADPNALSASPQVDLGSIQSIFVRSRTERMEFVAFGAELRDFLSSLPTSANLTVTRPGPLSDGCHFMAARDPIDRTDQAVIMTECGTGAANFNLLNESATTYQYFESERAHFHKQHTPAAGNDCGDSSARDVPIRGLFVVTNQARYFVAFSELAPEVSVSLQPGEIRELEDIAEEIARLAREEEEGSPKSPNARFETMMRLGQALEKALEISEVAAEASSMAAALERWSDVLSPETMRALSAEADVIRAGFSGFEVFWSLFADDLIDYVWQDSAPELRFGVKYSVQSGLLVQSAQAAGSLARSSSFKLGNATLGAAKVSALGPLGLTQVAISAIETEVRTLRQLVDRIVLGFELQAQAALVRLRFGLIEYSDVDELANELDYHRGLLTPDRMVIGGAISEDGARKLQILRGVMLARAQEISGMDYRPKLEGVVHSAQTLDENERNLMIQAITDFGRWATGVEHGLYTEYMWRVAERFELQPG